MKVKVNNWGQSHLMLSVKSRCSIEKTQKTCLTTVWCFLHNIACFIQKLHKCCWFCLVAKVFFVCSATSFSIYCVFFLSAFDATFGLLDRYASADSPTKTRHAPVHCCSVRALPRRRTDMIMVKNFRVVVTIEHHNGPKVVTIEKIKYWPNAEQRPNAASHWMHEGWRLTKAMNSWLK